MMRNLSHWLYNLSTGRIALAALIVFLLFTGLVLPKQAADADTSGAGSPDMSLIYSASDLYGMAEAYGPEGRAAYIRVRFTFDLVWPLVYAAFLVTAISWLSRKAFAKESSWQRINLIPVMGIALDYLENIASALVIGRYPTRTPVVDVLAPLFTFVKWIFVGGSFVVLIVVLVAALWRQNGSRR